MATRDKSPESASPRPTYEAQKFALNEMQAKHADELENSGLLQRARMQMGNVSPGFDGRTHVRIMVSEEHIERSPVRHPEVVFGLIIDKDNESFMLPLRIQVGVVNGVGEMTPYYGFTEEDVEQVHGMLTELEEAKQSGIIPDVTRDYLDIIESPAAA